MLNAIKTKLKKFLDLFSLSENLLRYIGGNEALPNPYTAEEEAELVAKLKTDEHVRDGLIEHNLRP